VTPDFGLQIDNPLIEQRDNRLSHQEDLPLIWGQMNLLINGETLYSEVCDCDPTANTRGKKKLSKLIITMQFTSLAFLVSSIVALPNGAPKCAINDAVISKGMRNATTDLGYAISTKAVNSTSWEFKVSGKQSSFAGILIVYSF
jgi:hypothetical protein